MNPDQSDSSNVVELKFSEVRGSKLPRPDRGLGDRDGGARTSLFGHSRKYTCRLLEKAARRPSDLITFNTNLSRFSARSHTSLLVILVIRAQPDTEGGHLDTGTE